MDQRRIQGQDFKTQPPALRFKNLRAQEFMETRAKVTALTNSGIELQFVTALIEYMDDFKRHYEQHLSPILFDRLAWRYINIEEPTLKRDYELEITKDEYSNKWMTALDDQLTEPTLLLMGSAPQHKDTQWRDTDTNRPWKHIQSTYTFGDSQYIHLGQQPTTSVQSLFRKTMRTPNWTRRGSKVVLNMMKTWYKAPHKKPSQQQNLPRQNYLSGPSSANPIYRR
ncbi:hypothetical protein EDD11_008922 [Mortierella claussenii]|nr:hypothetical protein EDD11_008922 [Mortierella claussenii]